MSTRRQFLFTLATAASSLGPGLSSSMLAKELRLPSGDLEALVSLMRRTPRERIIPVFVRKLEEGLPGSQFLAALYLAAVKTGDLHQMAQIHGARRLGEQLPESEKLLPLFWALDRVKQGSWTAGDAPITGKLPPAREAETLLRDAAERRDGEQARRALLAVAADRGGRHALGLLWSLSARNLSGTLGHLPIGVEGAWNMLEAIGWEPAGPTLSYLGFEVGRFGPDATYESSVEWAGRLVSQLPAKRETPPASPERVRELHAVIRAGSLEEARDLARALILEGRASAGDLWDAIALSAAELLVRSREGGSAIGSVLVHAVTGTSALRTGFELVEDESTRWTLWAQSLGYLHTAWLGSSRKEETLRPVELLDLAGSAGGGDDRGIREVLAELPLKAEGLSTRDPEPRRQSDRAGVRMLELLSKTPGGERIFLKEARRLVSTRATRDPHDVKYPVAAFEEARRARPAFRPYLLASTVHALHGSQSPVSDPVLRAREALRSQSESEARSL